MLYERVGMPNILSIFVVGRPGPEYVLPVAVLCEVYMLIMNLFAGNPFTFSFTLNCFLGMVSYLLELAYNISIFEWSGQVPCHLIQQRLKI